MRKIILGIFLFMTVCSGNAQIHEVGVFLGGSNYIGDVGATDYINPNSLAFGALYKWNKSSRYSWRASFMYSEIEGDDANADMSSRQERGFSFKNTIKEFSAGLEFNFLEFYLHDFSKPVTPYIYGGLSYFIFDDIKFDSGVAINNGNRNTFAIPMTLGVKAKIARHLVLGAEIGARYTFTNNLDGSNPDDPTAFRFGNLNSDDWYVFSGITLTYTFGTIPCYACFE